MTLVLDLSARCWHVHMRKGVEAEKNPRIEVQSRFVTYLSSSNEPSGSSDL